jgi:hypothetical protein
VSSGIWLENERPRFAGPFHVERTGIEPVTSGLQIQSDADLDASSDVGASGQAELLLSDASSELTIRQSDLTRI